MINFNTLVFIILLYNLYILIIIVNVIKKDKAVMLKKFKHIFIKETLYM